MNRELLDILESNDVPLESLKQSVPADLWQTNLTEALSEALRRTDLFDEKAYRDKTNAMRWYCNGGLDHFLTSGYKQATFEQTKGASQAESTDIHPKISILIPIYNVEDYLEKCLDSIAHQSFTDYEAICINDGSTDSSPEIIQRFVARYKNFRCIDKPNSGYGNSMNRGLQEAKGEYIGIVESDDYIHRDMYKILYDRTQNGTIDIVKANFYDCYANERIVLNREREKLGDSPLPFTFEERPEISIGHPSIWSAIYKRSLLEEYNIHFMEVKGGGWVDNPFFYETLARAKSIVYVPKGVYYYVKTRPGSSSNMQTDPMLPFTRMAQNLDVLEQQTSNNPEIKRSAYARAFTYIKGAFIDFDYDQTRQTTEEASKKLVDRMDEDLVVRFFAREHQERYYLYRSGIKNLKNIGSKILLYTNFPFDNPWNLGGDITQYCRDLIEDIITHHPEVTIFVLSSGFAYDATQSVTYFQKLGTVFGDRVIQFEIVNSPVPGIRSMILKNPLATLENKNLQDVFSTFLTRYGTFDAVHFQNFDGISLDVLDLKKKFPNTKFLYSMHTSYPLCATGTYYQQQKTMRCSPETKEEQCMQCCRQAFHTETDESVTKALYLRGKSIHQDRESRFAVKAEKVWIKSLDLTQYDETGNFTSYAEFTRKAQEKLNTYCDAILVDSPQLQALCVANGISKEKVTVVAPAVNRKFYAQHEPKEKRVRTVLCEFDEGLEEYEVDFLHKSLRLLAAADANRINLVCLVQSNEKLYIDLSFLHSITYIDKNAESSNKACVYGKKLDPFRSVDLMLILNPSEGLVSHTGLESIAKGIPVLAGSRSGFQAMQSSFVHVYEAENEASVKEKLELFLHNAAPLEKDASAGDAFSAYREKMFAFYGIGNAAANDAMAEVGESERCLLKYLESIHEFVWKPLVQTEKE